MDHLKKYPPDFSKPLEHCFNYIYYCNINFFEDKSSMLKNYWKYIIIIPLASVHLVLSAWFIMEALIMDRGFEDLAFAVPICIIMIQGISYDSPT